MKKATNDTRIRMTVPLPVAGDTVLTMSACAWNELSAMISAGAYQERRLGCEAIAQDYLKAADKIYRVLQARGYYD